MFGLYGAVGAAYLAGEGIVGKWRPEAAAVGALAIFAGMVHAVLLARLVCYIKERIKTKKQAGK